MNIVIGTVLIWAAALWMWRKLGSAPRQRAALEATWNTLCFTAPRVVVALLGAALFAELLPEDRMQALFGPEAGFAAVALGIALGPVTPGGAFVAFAIGSAALQSGAAPVPVLAYVTSWSLFALTKILAYEIPFMGSRAMVKRVVVSVPIPLLVAGLAWGALG